MQLDPFYSTIALLKTMVQRISIWSLTGFVTARPDFVAEIDLRTRMRKFLCAYIGR